MCSLDVPAVIAHGILDFAVHGSPSLLVWCHRHDSLMDGWGQAKHPSDTDMYLSVSESQNRPCCLDRAEACHALHFRCGGDGGHGLCLRCVGELQAGCGLDRQAENTCQKPLASRHGAMVECTVCAWFGVVCCRTCGPSFSSQTGCFVCSVLCISTTTN